jgi:hypothetical protein
MKLIILITFLIVGCVPVPEKVETKFETDGNGQYQGTELGMSWKL